MTPVKFGPANVNWTANSAYNYAFLLGVQSHMNHVLQARGFVLLNDVYDALGMPRTREGAEAGWSTQVDEETYVDFGLDNPLNATGQEVILTFNVTADILDVIWPPAEVSEDGVKFEILTTFHTKSKEQAGYIIELYKNLHALVECSTSDMAVNY